MNNQQIDYPGLVEKALLHVVHDVLGMVAEHGLPGRHHLYITFRTDNAGVEIDDALRERYPTEMTIVLQHEFWGLEVSDDRFCVTLSFNNVPQRLEVPFSAVTVFADPSVEFGLQFRSNAAPVEDAPTPATVAKLPSAARKPDAEEAGRHAPVPLEADGAAASDSKGDGAGEPSEQGTEETDEAPKVVALDRFRKK